MKKIILLLALIITVTYSSKAQNLDISKVAIMQANDNSRGVFIGDNTNQAIAILGAPTSITDKYFETDDVTAKVYSYNDSKLYFVDGKLDSYNIIGSNLQTGTVNGTTMKIGDEIKVLTRTITRPRGQHGSDTETITTYSFLNFDIIKESGKVNGLNYSYRVTCPIYKNGVAYDMVYGLLFTSNNKLASIVLTD